MKSGAKFCIEETLRSTELGVSRKLRTFYSCFVVELLLVVFVTDWVVGFISAVINLINS